MSKEEARTFRSEILGDARKSASENVRPRAEDIRNYHRLRTSELRKNKKRKNTRRSCARLAADQKSCADGNLGRLARTPPTQHDGADHIANNRTQRCEGQMNNKRRNVARLRGDGCADIRTDRALST